MQTIGKVIAFIGFIFGLSACHSASRESYTISPPPAQINDANINSIAIEALSDAIRTNPSVAMNYYKRSLLYLNSNKIEEALADIDRAEVLSPTIPAFLFAKSQILKAKGSTDLALKYALRVESMDFDTPKLYTTLADLYTTKKDTSNAAFYLKKAYSISPYNASTNYVEGQFWEMKGDTNKAIQKYYVAIDNNKFYKEAYQKLITIYDNEKRFDSSLVINSKAVKTFPDDVEFAIGIGDRLENKFLIDSAVVIYKENLKKFPNRVDLTIKIGNARLQQKRYDEALEYYTEALKKMNSNADVLYLTGLCHEKLEHFSEAQSFYIKALRINPEFEKAKDALDRVTYLINAALGY